METVYAALLNFKVSKSVDEDTIAKILEAAGAQVDSNQIKALVAGLADKNIDDLIKSASAAPVAVVCPCRCCSSLLLVVRKKRKAERRVKAKNLKKRKIKMNLPVFLPFRLNAIFYINFFLSPFLISFSI